MTIPAKPVGSCTPARRFGRRSSARAIPHLPSATPSGSAQLGGEPTFAETMVNEQVRAGSGHRRRALLSVSQRAGFKVSRMDEHTLCG
jgi:hypothetical protein